MDYEIKLSEHEVPVGVVVCLYVNDNASPEMDGESPMVFRKMLGGMPPREKLYHLVKNVPVAGLEGFVESARFSPMEAYSSKDAPTNAEYALFRDGKRTMHPHRPETAYRVVKSFEDEFFESSRFPFRQFIYAPVFETKVAGLVRNYSAQQLMGFFRMYQEDLHTLTRLEKIDKNDPRIKDQEIALEARCIEVMTAIIKKMNLKQAKLVQLLEGLDNAYLKKAVIPENALLVRVDG